MSGSRCACPITAADAYDCIAIRDRRSGERPSDEYSDECMCPCHDEDVDEPDEEAA